MIYKKVNKIKMIDFNTKITSICISDGKKNEGGMTLRHSAL